MPNNEAKPSNAKKVIMTLAILVVVIGGMIFLATQLPGILPSHTPRPH